MREFTITVTSDHAASSNPFEGLGTPPAGPAVKYGFGGKSEDPPKKENRISSVTLIAHLTDVDYAEAQELLEKMKEDAKKP